MEEFLLKGGKINVRNLVLLILIFFILISMVIAIHQLSIGHTTGIDFYYYWNTARLFLQNGSNPYSESVAIQNQIGIYGHTAYHGQDPQYFRNPAYALLPILFFSVFRFDWAYAIWETVNILLILLTCSFAFPSMPTWQKLIFLFIYQTAFGLIVGNFSIISALSLLVFIGYIVIQGKHNQKGQILVGALLVAATFKPQLSWIYILWFMIFSFRNKLFPLIYSFFGTLALCVIIMILFIPSWPVDFFRLLFTYQRDANLIDLRTGLFLPFYSYEIAKILGNTLLTIFIVLVLFCVFGSKYPKINNPIIQLALVGLLTFLFHPSGFSTEQLCLVLPVVAWMSYGKSSILKNTTWIAMFVLSYAFFASEEFTSLPKPILIGPFIMTLVWFVIILVNSSHSGIEDSKQHPLQIAQ